MSEILKILYFAYGSNLCIRQMNDRCPNNSKMGMGKLKGHRWIISKRGYANVVKSSDEEKLDVCEGVSTKCYLKENLEIVMDGRIQNCLTYVDPTTEEGVPSSTYANIINEGLCDSKLPEKYVEKYLRPKITL